MSVRRLEGPTPRFRTVLGIGALLATACAGPPDDQPEPLVGAQLVSGSSLDRQGIMVVASNRVAEFRSANDLSTVRWAGRVEFGEVSAAYSLGTAILVIAEDSTGIFRTIPTESFTLIDDVPPETRWISSVGGGALVANDRVIAVTPRGAREVVAPGEVLWAAPAQSDLVVALVADPGGSNLMLWEAGNAEPTSSLAARGRGPALLTRWGREVAIPSADGTILFLSLPTLEETGRVTLSTAATGLAVSPSQHRLYASLGASPYGLVQLNPVDGNETRLARSNAPLQALRTSLTGDLVLGFDGSATWAFAPARNEMTAIGGSWRDDLPAVFPGGDILIHMDGEVRLLEGEVRLAGRDLGEPVLVARSGDGFWLPYSWRSTVPRASTASVSDSADADLVPVFAPRRSGLLSLGAIPGMEAPDPEPDTIPPRPDTATLEAVPEVGEEPSEAEDGIDTPENEAEEGTEPGMATIFYVVAGSARQTALLARLRVRLTQAGYSTSHRSQPGPEGTFSVLLLVGPYDTRPEALEVAEALREEGVSGATILEDTVPNLNGRSRWN